MYTRRGVVTVHFDNHDNILVGSGKFTCNTSTILNKMTNYMKAQQPPLRSCLPSALAGVRASWLYLKHINNQYLVQIFLTSDKFYFFTINSLLCSQLAIYFINSIATCLLSAYTYNKQYYSYFVSKIPLNFYKGMCLTDITVFLLNITYVLTGFKQLPHIITYHTIPFINWLYETVQL